MRCEAAPQGQRRRRRCLAKRSPNAPLTQPAVCACDDEHAACLVGNSGRAPGGPVCRVLHSLQHGCLLPSSLGEVAEAARCHKKQALQLPMLARRRCCAAYATSMRCERAIVYSSSAYLIQCRVHTKKGKEECTRKDAFQDQNCPVVVLENCSGASCGKQGVCIRAASPCAYLNKPNLLLPLQVCSRCLLRQQQQHCRPVRPLLESAYCCSCCSPACWAPAPAVTSTSRGASASSGCCCRGEGTRRRRDTVEQRQQSGLCGRPA